MSVRLGVLLMTYGSPAADLHDLPEYLAAVRGGRPAGDELVAEFHRRYTLIGGSPLIEITRRQATAVETRLRSDGVDATAAVGMRFSPPAILDGLRALQEAGCGRVAGIVMSPQHSELLMGGYRLGIEAAISEMGPEAPDVALAPAWYSEHGFVMAVAERIREATSVAPRDSPVLLTAHSLPRRVADAEPGYIAQLGETARLVAQAAEIPEGQWYFCWQSAGHEPGDWMKPDFSDLLPRLRRDGHRGVLVAPIQFLADHLEILYDIDVAAREQATAAGLEFARIESLNVSEPFVGALARIARHAALGSPSPAP